MHSLKMHMLMHIKIWNDITLYMLNGEPRELLSTAI